MLPKVTDLTYNGDALRHYLLNITSELTKRLSDIQSLTDDSILKEIDQLKDKLIAIRQERMYSKELEK